jgi:hypothetical protein
MSDNGRKLTVLFGALTLLLPWTGWPQNASPERQAAGRTGSKPQLPSAPVQLQSLTRAGPPRSKRDSKPSLLEATRVSTENARRGAAADLARQDKTGLAAPKVWAPATADSESSTVLEFHPAEANAGASASQAASSKNSNKSALKNVHGSAYGSTVPGNSNHQVGGSAGVTSKSGKTSVYVETDQSRAASPR